MKLKRDTVRDVLTEFIDAYGFPNHIKPDETSKISRLIDIYHRRLSEVYTEDTFAKGALIAWNTCYQQFPKVAHFHLMGEKVERAVDALDGYKII